MSPISLNEESDQKLSKLNVNAMEFIPISSNNQVVGESSTSSVRNKNSGTVPKKFEDRRSNNQKKFFKDNQRNWRNSSNRQNEQNNHQEEERKFYRNNYRSYRNNNENPSTSNGYTSKFKITIKPESAKNKELDREVKNEEIENLQPEELKKEPPKPKNEKPKSKRNEHNPRNRNKKPANKISISQRDQLIKEIEKNTLECMICCEKIKAYSPIWSCTVCFHILHLNCIKTWMKKSKDENGLMRCPACNQIAMNKPKDYMCFCGKLKNPQVNRNDLAHSCGNMCLSTQNCDHPCGLVCHPGPHEICHAAVQKFCGCGKSSRSYQCSMKATFECDSTCEKILNCGVHKCLDKCHQAACKECSIELECTCHCGNESRKLPCIPENIEMSLVKYSCEKECGKTLKCGQHSCTDKCHQRECKPCKLLPQFVKSCPCGKMSIKSDFRASCTDPVPLCKSICKKTLKCGPLSAPHACASKCHLGDCPPCNQTSKIKCRCGRKEETIPCKDLINSDLRCGKKCNKFKSCGRHKCNTECCIALDHTCVQTCNRQLDCKKHKCSRTCHIGNCAPCHRVSFDELRCECGLTVIYPPVYCGTSIIDCTNKCVRRHKCSHPIAHNCHSEPECPPCVFLTSKYCYGNHEERKTIPCNQDSFSCGMPCSKMLKCGRHLCIKTCHPGDCEKINEHCNQKCQTKRVECEHNCGAKCHDGECPDNLPCRERIQVSCQCGNLKSIKTCEQVEYENRKLQRIRLTAQQNDEASTLSEMLGDFKKTTKILDCNDDCKTIERNRRLDIAFKVQNPTLATTPKFVPSYSEHVRNFYKKDPQFVNMVHDKLTELVKLAKETKAAAYRCHSFPSMNRDKRHVIHDVAEMFGVETKAYDAEPNRNIVATAVREYCWLPAMSPGEVIQRENGVRRPPMSQLFKK